MHHNGNLIKVAEICVQPVKDELKVSSTLWDHKYLEKGPKDLAGSSISINEPKPPNVGQVRSNMKDKKQKPPDVGQARSILKKCQRL